tara:strand:- start:178 stop:408 length:231 start_codon:yes stop_codon:yes gene_type:complete
MQTSITGILIMTDVIACAIFGLKHVLLVQDNADNHGDSNDDGEQATAHQDPSSRVLSLILLGLINVLVPLRTVIHS